MRKTQWDVSRHIEITCSHLFLTFKFKEKKNMFTKFSFENSPFALTCPLLLFGSERSRHKSSACKHTIYHDICEAVRTLRQLWSICSVSKPFAHSGYEENIKKRRKFNFHQTAGGEYMKYSYNSRRNPLLCLRSQVLEDLKDFREDTHHCSLRIYDGRFSEC